MATFSDMAILLMAFFVIMLSFTEFDPQVYQKINGSMKFAFGVNTINLKMDIPTARSMMIDSFSPNLSQTAITPTIRQRMETDGQLIVRKTQDSVSRFDIEREFYILEAALEAEIKAVMKRLAELTKLENSKVVLPLAEVQKLNAKPKLLEDLAAMQAESRGWFAD